MGRRATGFLLDASALYPLILRLRETLLEHASKLAVLDLTFYEVGNVLWKEHRRGVVKNPRLAARLFGEVLTRIPVISTMGDLPEILETAVKEGLTFYDASYLHAARKHGIPLVTEDRELRAFPEAIGVEELVTRMIRDPSGEAGGH